MIGPTRITIVLETCRGCQFHTEELVRSGREPLHEHHCSHPALPGWMQDGFGNIGLGERTPDWCPAKKGG